MRLEAQVRKRVGGLLLDVVLRPSESLALFGPSGAGKSTVLACLAGLVRPDEGRITFDGKTLFDSARSIDVPPHKRGVSVAFQDHRLFPHCDVRKNITFAPGGDRGERLDAVIEALALAPLLERKPQDLSGGERTRVSLARALLSPAVLVLLDEPMAGLDAAMRKRAIALVRQAEVRWGKVLVYVSHSPAEVAAVTEHVIALDQGSVVVEGPPMNVLTAGSVLALWREEGFENNFEGVAVAEGVRAGDQLWRTGRTDIKVGERVMVGLGASDVILARHRPEALSARNVLSGKVSRITGSSEVALVRVDVGGVSLFAEVTAEAARELELSEGAAVWAIVKATSLRMTRAAL